MGSAGGGGRFSFRRSFAVSVWGGVRARGTTRHRVREMKGVEIGELRHAETREFKKPAPLVRAILLFYFLF